MNLNVGIGADRLAALLADAEHRISNGDMAGAELTLLRAEREGIRHPDLFRIRGELLALKGRFAEAGSLFNHALALAPHDPRIVTDIGRLLVAEDRIREAVGAFNAALRIAPGNADLWYELGSALEILEDTAGARSAYENARAIAPGAAAPWAALAALAVRAGDTVGAQHLVDGALQREPGNVGAALVLARLELHRGEHATAGRRLQDLLNAGRLDERQTQWALSMLGDALDAEGRSSEAFAAYAQMNELMLNANAHRFGSGGLVENHLSLVNRLTDWFARQDRAMWRRAQTGSHYESPVRRHVFLFGYPRSGNTLTENVLASLEDVRGLEERPTLADADAAFLRNDAGMDRLVMLDPTLADEQRRAYWSRVRAEVPDVDGKVFVDMAPLNGIKMQVIFRLFPDALVVRCLRDPRDVIFSCFRQHFKVNASTYQMGRLEDVARHYDAVMKLTELHMDALPLPVHVMKYEHLVREFDGATRELAQFVGVPWNENVRAFHRTASGRGVKTASMHQVQQALFDGSGQWRRYSRQLEPVMPWLDPWIRLYGYATS